MIQHGRVSLKHFRERMMNRWGLKDPVDGEPVVMFGLYNKRDHWFFHNHKGHITVVWLGSDSSKTKKLKREAKHIALSKSVQERLKKRGIESEIVPICAGVPKINIQPMGNHIYFYGEGSKYGEQYVKEVEKRTGLKVIKATKTTYKNIEDIYKQCFIGLRLTREDGLPNTVVEMGLMGRKCVYNGELPGSIPWVDIGDICSAVKREYRNRHLDNSPVAHAMYDYVNITNDFLKIP